MEVWNLQGQKKSNCRPFQYSSALMGTLQLQIKEIMSTDLLVKVDDLWHEVDLQSQNVTSASLT